MRSTTRRASRSGHAPERSLAPQWPRRLRARAKSLAAASRRIATRSSRSCGRLGSSDSSFVATRSPSCATGTTTPGSTSRWLGAGRQIGFDARRSEQEVDRCAPLPQAHHREASCGVLLHEGLDPESLGHQLPNQTLCVLVAPRRHGEVNVARESRLAARRDGQSVHEGPARSRGVEAGRYRRQVAPEGSQDRTEKPGAPRGGHVAQPRLEAGLDGRVWGLGIVSTQARAHQVQTGLVQVECDQKPLGRGLRWRGLHQLTEAVCHLYGTQPGRAAAGTIQLASRSTSSSSPS